MKIDLAFKNHTSKEMQINNPATIVLIYEIFQ